MQHESPHFGQDLRKDLRFIRIGLRPILMNRESFPVSYQTPDRRSFATNRPSDDPFGVRLGFVRAKSPRILSQDPWDRES
jgi:hypothetical protein